jgi:Spy/CpxP family protein refolding chaperone
MTITRTSSALTVVALGALLHLTSFAQASGPAGGPPMGMQAPMPAGERMHGMMGSQKMHEKQEARHLKHLEDMKVFLQLQASQEAAWNEFVGIMKTPMKRPTPLQKSDVEKLTTPERIDKMMAFKAERDAEMSQRMTATKKFYASLTPAQQKVFDTHTQKFMERGPMEHHGKMHP